MNQNRPQDESEDPPSGQSTYKDRIDVFLAGIEEDIRLLHEGISIDELSANEIEQSKAKYYGVLVRLLTLLVSEYPPSGQSTCEDPIVMLYPLPVVPAVVRPSEQSTCKDRIEDLIARIEDHITLLREYTSRDELSANEIEQSLSKYYGVLVRLLTLRVKVEANEPKSYSENLPMYSIIGEPKISISTAADSPESYDDEDDDED